MPWRDAAAVGLPASADAAAAASANAKQTPAMHAAGVLDAIFLTGFPLQLT